MRQLALLVIFLAATTVTASDYDGNEPTVLDVGCGAFTDGWESRKSTPESVLCHISDGTDPVETGVWGIGAIIQYCADILIEPFHRWYWIPDTAHAETPQDIGYDHGPLAKEFANPID